MRPFDEAGLRALLLTISSTVALTPGCSQSAGISRRGFDIDLCSRGQYPLDRIEPAQPVDYVSVQRRDGAAGLSAHPVAEHGRACAGATEPLTCEGNLLALDKRGWIPDPSLGEYRADIEHFLTFTRGDQVGAAGSAAELATFLAPIDDPDEALLLVRASGRELSCDWSGPVARRTERGFEVVTRTGNNCGGQQYEQLVLVANDGQVSIEEEERRGRSQPNCSIGRRPSGFTATHSPRGGVGVHFAEMATLETASVQAFVHLGRELEAHGAPADLVRAARRAARDEARHARVTRRLARRFGVEPRRPARVAPPAPRPLSDLARENVLEGCVRETYGALVATWQAAHARDREIARVMSSIAADETRHAALAWAVDAWARSRLAPDAAAVLDAALESAVSELETATADSPSVQCQAGTPGERDARALLAALRQQLWSRA